MVFPPRVTGAAYQASGEANRPAPGVLVSWYPDPARVGKNVRFEGLLGGTAKFVPFLRAAVVRETAGLRRSVAVIIGEAVAEGTCRLCRPHGSAPHRAFSPAPA